MTLFIEDPLSRIVAVHWADEGEPPPDGFAPPYCGRYGYGAIVVDLDGRIISAVPYGPNQLPPMVGTFAVSGPHGGINHPLPGKPPPETLTAPPYGLIAQYIILGPNAINFTNQQLIVMVDPDGVVGTYQWIEHMATGYTASIPRVPLVVASYTINMNWQSSYVDPLDEVGIGISHSVPGYVGPIRGPPEPAAVLGSNSSGPGSFFYDFKAPAYWSGNIHVTEANQFDPGLGGPAYLWWMSRRKTGSGYTAWSASSQFMITTILGLGDHYTWEIIATCAPFPSTPTLI